MEFVSLFVVQLILFHYFCGIKNSIMNRFTQILHDQRAELAEINVAQLCPRLKEQQIDLNSRLAQIVIGVRRSGKSTLCQKVLLQRMAAGECRCH